MVLLSFPSPPGVPPGPAGAKRTLRARSHVTAQTANYDLAVLDINIGGHSIDPVAEVIDRRGLPFFFVSGYGSGGRPEQFSDRPLLQKPVMSWKLGDTINSILSISDTEFPAGHMPRRRGYAERGYLKASVDASGDVGFANSAGTPLQTLSPFSDGWVGQDLYNIIRPGRPRIKREVEQDCTAISGRELSVRRSAISQPVAACRVCGGRRHHSATAKI